MASNAFEIQGHRFTLKPYSPGNHNRILNELPKLEEKVNSGDLEYFPYTKELLRLFADGPIDKLDATDEAEDYDARLIEEQFENFLPPSIRRKLLLYRL